MELSCAFTGHRPKKYPWGYDEEHPDCVKLKLLIVEQVAALAANGVTTFLSGMAEGADTWGALAVLALKESCPALKLVCVLPCETQANKWSSPSRERYFDILAEADRTIYISRHYTDTCMLDRNRFLVEHANFVLAIYTGERRGGTAATVRYAQQEKCGLIVIDPNTLQVTPFTIPAEGQGVAERPISDVDTTMI